MNCLLVPTLGLNLPMLDRLAASIDHPIKKCLVINCEAHKLHDFLVNHQDWDLYGGIENLGVSASWNHAPRKYPEGPWLIVNEDYWFWPGQLKEICQCADKHADTEPIIFMVDKEKPSWPCFVWTRMGVNKFGLFDENFWPAYYEDCDMMVRHRIEGIKSYRCVFPEGTPQNHGKGQPTGPHYNAMIDGCNALNQQYWFEKWGNSDYFGTPEWTTPFGKSVPTRYWVVDESKRAERVAIFNEFISRPDASVYS